MLRIQAEMTERALELLCLKQQTLILDIGCGSGLSGDVLTENGHAWIGCDISNNMLGVALSREVEGDLVYSDMGQGMMFRPASFDAVVSISALQWLCNADRSSHNPYMRLQKFFVSLYSVLSSKARAVFQFYPESEKQIEMITGAAVRAGFGKFLLVDFPESTKAKKFYLILFTSASAQEYEIPTPLGVSSFNKRSEGTITVGAMVRDPKRKGRGKNFQLKDKILEKKERRRNQGKHVHTDSKFTGRRRKARF